MGITNLDALTSVGNITGRRDVLEIIEAGLRSADPYDRIGELIRIEGRKLIVGHAEYEPAGSPVTGEQVFDLDDIDRILVFGAGKGVQRVGQAIEAILGDHLTGGHLIDKRGAPVVLKRIEVTMGAHPVPDEACVQGCRRIMEMTTDLTPRDLVFTVGASGFSSLLTIPVPGVSLEDVRRTVYLMQIERGAPTWDLSPIRNHLDMLKGGRISARLRPAHVVHILAKSPGAYDRWVYENSWFHTLPDYTTFADAVRCLKKWDAWDAVPQSVRSFLERADPRWETVKPADYVGFGQRMYGVMPFDQGVWPEPMRRAEALGYRAVTLCTDLKCEARDAGRFAAAIARSIEALNQPFAAPVALITGGELLVTVGQEVGVGGRNQEYALSSAEVIAGSRRVVIGAVDTDGTDGPGVQYQPVLRRSDDGRLSSNLAQGIIDQRTPPIGLDGVHGILKQAHQPGQHAAPTLAGGVVDGATIGLARERGVDLNEALRRHNVSPALMALDSGILATQNTGLCDLGVILVTREPYTEGVQQWDRVLRS